MNALEFDQDLHVLTKAIQGQSIDTTAELYRYLPYLGTCS